MCKPSTYLVVTYTEDFLSQYALKTYLSIHKTFLHNVLKTNLHLSARNFAVYLEVTL